jgi:hypothetical protein
MDIHETPFALALLVVRHLPRHDGNKGAVLPLLCTEQQSTVFG